MIMKKKLLNNTISSLILQVTTIVCGFILPRLILDFYGSEVNGLVNSITQFLSIIAFLDLGVGAVFQSSLYKPLAENDNESLSRIFVSGQRFFTRLAEILLGYVILLICIYPFISNQSFGFSYTATLIVAMSISSFAQYYFGMANGLFLTADQRGYISYNVQIVTLVFNTLACYVLIKFGASIHLVKLTTSCIYLARPIVLKIYVDKHYQINHRIKYDREPIEQKWNGFAQHVTSVILESTDTVVLTIFSTLSNVSIYSVYYLVIAGIKQLFTATTNGVQALIGELYARKDDEALEKVFSWTEWLIHTATTFVFGCTLVLIVPFVMVYTKGITDANYNQPLFAVLIVLAYAAYSYRLPYHIVIKAGVHYKQTQNCYLTAAIMNIVVSVLTVKWFGLIGVAIGTLVAMAYQTIWMAWYDSKNIINWQLRRFLKQIAIDAIILFVGFFLTRMIKLSELSYMCWIIMAIQVVLIWLAIVVVINFIFYRKMITSLLNRIFSRFMRLR